MLHYTGCRLQECFKRQKRNINGYFIKSGRDVVLYSQSADYLSFRLIDGVKLTFLLKKSI